MADVAWLGTVVSVLAAVAVLGVVHALVTDDREPTIVLAWLFVVLLLPVLGSWPTSSSGGTSAAGPGAGPACRRPPR